MSDPVDSKPGERPPTDVETDVGSTPVLLAGLIALAACAAPASG